MKDLQTLHVEYNNLVQLLLVVKFCTGLKKAIGFQKETPLWGFEERVLKEK
jgi:hypothetical protein